MKPAVCTHCGGSLVYSELVRAYRSVIGIDDTGRLQVGTDETLSDSAESDGEISCAVCGKVVETSEYDFV